MGSSIKLCDSVLEAVAYNAMSCGPGVTLHWCIDWSPCFFARGGGYPLQFAHLLIPIRGDGRRPLCHSALPCVKRSCHDHSCMNGGIRIKARTSLWPFTGVVHSMSVVSTICASLLAFCRTFTILLILVQTRSSPAWCSTQCSFDSFHICLICLFLIKRRP